MTLPGLALSRSTLDRAAHRRAEPDLLSRLMADPATAVLLLDAERGPVAERSGGVGLVLVDPATALGLLPVPGPDPDAAAEAEADAAGPPAEPYRAFLGEDGAGRSHVLLTVPSTPSTAYVVPDAADAVVAAPEGARWAGLREVGALLDDTDAGLLTSAVALANWHGTHRCCARCGAPTVVVTGGWARQCPVCGAEHYPRTDPAVIMAVVDGDERILLGRQSRWPEHRYSTLAGFVEPGESLEAAVRREVLEESGVVVGEVTYHGSQPWPFPSSLMLGFFARATSTETTPDGEELAEARWWSREEFTADLASGEVLLPPSVSIARRLIEHWYGRPITDAPDAWR